MGILFANNVNMQLAADLAADDTSFSVIAGQGSQCPEIAADSTDYMLLKIRNKNGLDEIVKIIEHELNSDTFIIGDSTEVPHTPSTDGRAYEKTLGGYQTALAIKASDAHKITMPVTAATLEDALIVAGSGTTTDDFKKLHAITSTHTEINQLHESGVVKADFEKLHAITLSAVEANLLDADNRTIGDIITKTSAGAMGVIAAAVAGNYFKSVGAATLPVWGKLSLSDTGTKIGFVSTTSSGGAPVVVTGIGFKPSVVIFLSTVVDNDYASFTIGLDNGTSRAYAGFWMEESSFSEGYTTRVHVVYDDDYSIYGVFDGASVVRGYISSMGSDGFTITKASSPVTGPSVLYLALP